MAFDSRAYEKIKSELPKGCAIVAVTKLASPENVAKAFYAGARQFGENRINDAIEKQKAVKAIIGNDAEKISWHFIGHLQSNKASKAVQHFSMIQSVDSAKLAGLISKEAVKLNKTIDILLEFNTSHEAQKHGFTVGNSDDIDKILLKISKLPNLNARGIMTVASISHPEQDFELAQKIFNEISRKKTFRDFSILSMGMSGDYKIALGFGSNLLRIGTILFPA